MKKKKQNDEAPLPAREAALRILERTGISAPVQSLLDTKLTGGLFSRQEAALTTELVYGYLRSEIRISWLLSQFMKAPEKLPASMKLMIGIAAYELLYLDRIPAHASVSAAVDAVRARFGQGLSRVANGVLRSLIRLSESEDLKAFAFYESRIKDPMERLSVFHSVPRWMLELWTKGYGPEKAETFARAVSVVPSPCVRVNAARDEWEALRDFLCKEGEAVGISGVRFAPGTQPEYMRDYLRQGRLSIQGAGSQLVLEALDAPRWEGPVWDACAGRGGKTLALVELGVPVLAASDTYQPRLRGMRDDAKRLVLKTPPLFCASAAEPALRGTPRTILLDVPCSGLGTLARHPDLRTLRTPGQVAGLVDLQRRILDAVWSYLPSGGHLAYITCTMNPAENEGQIDAFLARTPGASLEKQWQIPVFYIVFNSVFNSYFVYRNLKLILREQCIIYCREIIIRNIICSVFIHLYVNFFFHLIAIRRVSEFCTHNFILFSLNRFIKLFI